MICRRVSQVCEKRLLASSCLSVLMEQLGFHCWDFHEILYLWILRKSVKKFNFDENLTRIIDTLHADLCTFMRISRWIILRMTSVSDKRCREMSWVLCSLKFFFSKIVQSVRKYGNYGTSRQVTDDYKTERMRFACWMTKATDTHSEYIIIVVARQQWLREWCSAWRYTYIAFLVTLNW